MPTKPNRRTYPNDHYNRPIRVRLQARKVIDNAVSSHPAATVVDVASAMAFGWELLTTDQRREAFARAKACRK